MNIYQIDAEIQRIYEQAVDPDTGEIDEQAVEWLDRLTYERERKIENIALWYKNTAAESKAIYDEAQELLKRKKALDRRLEWQKRYLAHALAGEKFDTPRVQINYRSSETVSYTDEDSLCSWLLDNGHNDAVKSTVTILKPAVKKLLKAGEQIPGATLESNRNINIK